MPSLLPAQTAASGHALESSKQAGGRTVQLAQHALDGADAALTCHPNSERHLRHIGGLTSSTTNVSRLYQRSSMLLCNATHCTKAEA